MLIQIKTFYEKMISNKWFKLMAIFLVVLALMRCTIEMRFAMKIQTYNSLQELEMTDKVILHIVSPLRVADCENEAQSSPFCPLDQSQSVALASMQNAKTYSKNTDNVILAVATFPEDSDIIPPNFVRLPVLSRSTAEVYPHIKTSRPLPFVQDIFNSVADIEYDYLVFTTSNTLVHKEFYDTMPYIMRDKGLDAFTVSSHGVSPLKSDGTLNKGSKSDLDEIYAMEQNLEERNSYDCFVMKKKVLSTLDMGDLILGPTEIGKPIFAQLSNDSNIEMKEFLPVDLKVTYHLGFKGDESMWKKEDKETIEYNRINTVNEICTGKQVWIKICKDENKSKYWDLKCTKLSKKARRNVDKNFKKDNAWQYIDKWCEEALRLQKDPELHSKSSNGDEAESKENDTSDKETAMVHSKIAEDDDDPCTPTREKRSIDDLVKGTGVLYVVSGTEDFVENGFLPAIDFLRNTMGFGDASSSEGEGRDLKWAIATEPHLCRGVLRDVLKFFDVVTTYDVLYSDQRRNPTLISETPKKSNDNRSLKAVYSTVLGQGDMKERTNDELRHWVKALKVHAMADSPFETTIYMDTDTLPCTPIFHNVLLKEIGRADVALTGVDMHVIKNVDGPKEMINIDHYVKDGNPNQHNSALVVLDMTSTNTRNMLNLYESIFSETDPPPTLDQPSLGIAMNLTSTAGNLNHVDLKVETFCRTKNLRTEGEPSVNPVCGNGCILVHKEKSLDEPVTCLTAACIQKEASMIARPFFRRELFVSKENKFLDTILVKTHKCASSTMAGVVLRISEKYGGDVKWKHAIAHTYKDVDRDQSFLLTTVRNPANRATSRFYFTNVSRLKSNDDSKTFMAYLKSMDGFRRNWATTNNGGYQLMYTYPGRLPENSAWSSDTPNEVLKPWQVMENVKKVLKDYNFIALTERMDESLVALAILMNIKLTDVLVMPSKSSSNDSEYYFHEDDQTCYKLKPSPRKLPTEIEEYYNSEEWRARNYGDYLLHEAVSQSLDLTIESIGKTVFEDALTEYRRLSKVALMECASQVYMPCSSTGEPQIELSTESCYTKDLGCAHQCVDEVH